VGDALLAVVLAGSLVALYLHPRRIREWHVATAGGLAAWLLSPLSLRDGVDLLAGGWSIFAFFLGLMLSAAGAEASGLYAVASRLLAARPAGASPVVVVLLTGAAITAILSNDAAPLVLTPAVFVAATTRGFDPRASAFAATFAADGASLLLPVSNPVNLLFLERLDLAFGWYASTILPAATVGIAALALVHWRASRRRPAGWLLPSPLSAEPPPRAAAGSTRLSLALVALLGVAYLAAGVAAVPLGLVTLLGGTAMVVPGLLLRRASPRTAVRALSPGLFVFIAGLLLMVESAAAAGFFDRVGDLLETLPSANPLLAVAVTAALATLLSNVMNNWPAALLLSAAIFATPGQPPELVAGALIGCSIGANLTMFGSLSTVLWLNLARPRGLDCTPTAYARAAFLPTLAALAASSLVAALMLSV